MHLIKKEKTFKFKFDAYEIQFRFTTTSFVELRENLIRIDVEILKQRVEKLLNLIQHQIINFVKFAKFDEFDNVKMHHHDETSSKIVVNDSLFQCQRIFIIDHESVIHVLVVEELDHLVCQNSAIVQKKRKICTMFEL